MSYTAGLKANARKKLIDTSGGDGGYMMKIDVSKLTWHEMEDGSKQVVSVDAAAKTKEAVEEKLQDSSKPDAVAPEPFVFSAIVFITYEHFYAMSCGNWKGRTVAAPTFADQKLRFTGKAPTDDSELAKDFHIAREKLEQIFKAAKTSDRHVQRGVFMEPFPGSPPSEMKLQFTHRLFEKIHKGDEEIEGLLPEFTIGEWPVASEPAKQALAEMKYTHRVNYLAAFDATPEGNLIRPDAYEARLRGALAQIRFTLSNWYIGQKGENPPKDVFMANIAHIRVLAPPTKLSASPKRPRKKFTAQDDVSGDISPKKPRLGP